LEVGAHVAAAHRADHRDHEGGQDQGGHGRLEVHDQHEERGGDHRIIEADEPVHEARGQQH
jgi:hypothetical protein